MEIDTERFLVDILKLNKIIKNNLTYSIISSECNALYEMNVTMKGLNGPKIEEDIFKEEQKILSIMDELDLKSEYRVYKKIFFSNLELYKEIFKNTTQTYLKTDFKSYVQKDDMKKYTEKETKDIILSFFSQYGNKIYQISKNIFDENRIQMGYKGKNYYSNFYVSSRLLKSGYICVGTDIYNTKTLGTIAHELGHAIDSQLFLFPQQKKLRIIDDLFGEIPSTFFELEMLSYLKKQNIDNNGALSYECQILRAINIYHKRLLEKINSIDKGDLIECDWIDRENYIYGMGYYISLAMSQLSRQNPKEYFRTFTNVICSRKECDLIDLLDIADINKEQFISGEIYIKGINEKVLERKKRFGYID